MGETGLIKVGLERALGYRQHLLLLFRWLPRPSPALRAPAPRRRREGKKGLDVNQILHAALTTVRTRFRT